MSFFMKSESFAAGAIKVNHMKQFREGKGMLAEYFSRQIRSYSSFLYKEHESFLPPMIG